MLKKLGWQGLLFSIVVLTININKVIYIGEGAKFNATFADLFLPIVGLIILIDAIKHKRLDNFKYMSIFIGLVVWLVFTGVLNIYSGNVVNQGIMGILEEVIKTLICIAYFWVGYNTLNYISETQVNKLLKISLVVFIFLGLIIFVLAQNNINIMGTNSNYAIYYMGTDTDPNHAAMFLTIMFFYIGAKYQESLSKKALVLQGLLLGLTAIALILTGSRGGLVGFTLGITTLMLFNLKHHRKQIVIIGLFIVISLLAVVNLDTFVFHDTFSSRIIYKLVNFSDGFDVRFNLTQVAFEMGKDHLLTGVGRGNFNLNKEYYFKALSLPIRGDIPHNTYMGLFAEVGLIGLILYSMPILILIKKATYILKKKELSEYTFVKRFPWFFSIAVAIGIQASVLNVENRRFLWFLVGLMIAYFNQLIAGNKEVKLKPFNTGAASDTLLSKLNKKYMVTVLLAVMLPALIFTCINEKVEMSYMTVKDSYQYEIPVVFDDHHGGVTFKSSIYGISDDKAEDVANVSIHEIRQDGSKRLILTEIYPSVKGDFVYHIDNLSRGSKLIVEYKNLSHTLNSILVKPLEVQFADKVMSLKEFHYLLPKIVQSNFNHLYWQTIKQDENKVDFEEMPLSISNQFQINNITTELKNEMCLIEIEMIALRDIEFSYKFWAIGYPNDLHYIDSSRYSFGYEAYDIDQPFDTKELKENTTFVVSFEIPRTKGKYQLELGLNYYDQKIYKSLQIDNLGNTRMPIGSINLD